MYAGMLNTIFGEPGSGKSWLALMAVIQGVRDGRRSVWWDFESSTSTLATRLVALGAADLVGCDDILWATPDLAGDKAAIEKFARWLSEGQRPGMIVIDSAESAGLSTDSNDAAPWYLSHTSPFTDTGSAVVLLDHIPKRREDRPPGPIGSQHKRAKADAGPRTSAHTPAAVRISDTACCSA